MQMGSGGDAGKGALGLQPDAIEAQLDRVLASSGFVNSSRMARFLRLAVEKTIRAEPEALKEYVIGVEVFDKPPAFDPRVDSIVRVEARRLRRKLREYYEEAGKRDPILIEFPEGSYVPAFHDRRLVAHSDEVPDAACAGVCTIAVLPFTDIGGDEDERAFCDGLSDDLNSALTKIPGFRVASRRATLQLRGAALSIEEIGKRLNVGMVLDATVRAAGDRVRIAVQLINVRDGFNIWSETYERRRRDVLAVQAELAEAIARDLVAGPIRQVAR